MKTKAQLPLCRQISKYHDSVYMPCPDQAVEFGEYMIILHKLR